MTVGVIPYATLKQNSLALTSWFETTTPAPNCYGVTAGNFDGMGISWGAIQWNLGQGTVQPIWKYLFTNYYDKCLVAFNNDKGSLDYVKNLITTGTVSSQVSWGDQISVVTGVSGTNKHKVVEPWNTYFKQLGTMQEAIDKQISSAQVYFDKAESWKDPLGTWSRRGYALLFDISVQKGNFPQGCIDQVNADMSAYNTAGKTREEIEDYRLKRIAYRRINYGDISSAGLSPFTQRKNAIANGSGVVYGSMFYTDPYDAILEPAYDTDVIVAESTTSTTTTTTTDTPPPPPPEDANTTVTTDPDTGTTTTTTTTTETHVDDITGQMTTTITTVATTTDTSSGQTTITTTTTTTATQVIAVLQKVYPIVIDIESGVQLTIKSSMSQMDSNVVLLAFSLVQDGLPFDLTGYTTTLIIKKPDASILQIPIDGSNATDNITTGLVSILLPSTANDKDGIYFAELRLVDGAGDRLVTESFSYTVRVAYLNQAYVEAENPMEDYLQAVFTKGWN